MEIVFAMALRGGLSLLLGLMLSIGGLFLSHLILPVWSVTLQSMALGAGVGAGVGCFLAWLKPESGRRVISIGFALAFGAAIIGSFAGYFYTELFNVDVRNVMLISTGYLRSPAVWTFVTFGTLVSTSCGAVYYGFRLWRYHEV